MKNNLDSIKTVRKWFDISMNEKEEAFLEDMHRQGWCFVDKSIFGKYTFIPCQPEEMVYQLDYNPKALKNTPDYLRMFWDLGWESCYIHNGFIIFRKPKRLMNGKEEIYSNNEERLAYIKRRMLSTIILYIINALIWGNNLFTRIHFMQPGKADAMDIGGIILVTIYLLLFSGFAVYFIIRYIQMKNSLK